jgi:tetratricopeptide (TPR) repeat protein
MKRILILLLVGCPCASSSFAHSARPVSGQSASPPDAFQNGLAALQGKHFAEALAELTTAEGEHPDDPRIHNFRGIALAQLGKNDDAANEYAAAIRLDPRMENAYRNLGFLKWTLGSTAEARESLERAVKLSPEDGFAHYYLGRVELQANRYVLAFHELEISGIPPPSDADFWVRSAIGYKAVGRPEDERKSLAEIEKLPLSEAQWTEAAAQLLDGHETGAAIRMFQKARDQGSPVVGHFNLALAYLTIGAYEQAIQEARVYADGGSSAPEWSVIGIASAHLNQRDQCIDALRRAATLAPNEEEHWLNLTRELMEFGRYPEAIKEVQNGLAANPKSYALHLRLGAVYLATESYPKAESEFRDLIAAGDPLPTSYVGLAQVLIRTGRPDEAATELAAAEKKLGPQFLLSYFRGLALGRAGKLPEALAAFQTATKLNPNNSDAHFNLGKTESTLGMLHESITELQTVVRIDPDNVQAKRLLSQVYRRAGDEKTAMKFARASTGSPHSPDELLGDFFLPRWRFWPSKGARVDYQQE